MISPCDMPSSVTELSWEQDAAARFAQDLRRPEMYGNPPRRDVIGWVASLFDPADIRPWILLCASFRTRLSVFHDKEIQDKAQETVVAAIIERVVLPLQHGETRRVLTTNIRRHVRRTAAAGLTLMHAFDFHLALFDLEEGLHNSAMSSLLPSAAINFRQHVLKQLKIHSLEAPEHASQNNGQGEDAGQNRAQQNGVSQRFSDKTEESIALELDLTASNFANGTYGTADFETSLLSWEDVFTLKYFFNIAVEKFRSLCEAVRTRHVQERIERYTTNISWALRHAAECGLNLGQARVINLVVLRGSSVESQVALQRSHFTVFQENDPLVFAAAISTLDPERAILIADKYVGLTVGRDEIQLTHRASKIALNPGRSLSNVRKLLYADVLLHRRDSGAISDSEFMHLCQMLVLLNSGHGEATPGSRWADPWPHWPPIADGDKELLASGYARGNIVAGALLASTILANHITNVGTTSFADCSAAIAQLKQITELGDAAAPNYVGLALSLPGPLEDIPEAVRYYRLAVERGNKNAPALLGNLLHRTGGDATECVDLCKLTIARGGRYGHRFLAEILSVGVPGVPQDMEEARRLYQEAANLGDPVAADKVVANHWQLLH